MMERWSYSIEWDHQSFYKMVIDLNRWPVLLKSIHVPRIQKEIHRIDIEPGIDDFPQTSLLEHSHSQSWNIPDPRIRSFSTSATPCCNLFFHSSDRYRIARSFSGSYLEIMENPGNHTISLKSGDKKQLILKENNRFLKVPNSRKIKWVNYFPLNNPIR